MVTYTKLGRTPIRVEWRQQADGTVVIDHVYECRYGHEIHPSKYGHGYLTSEILDKIEQAQRPAGP